jgi:hypothetical protein
LTVKAHALELQVIAERIEEVKGGMARRAEASGTVHRYPVGFE